MSNAQPSESMAKPIPIEILSESEEEQEEKEEGGGHASMAVDEDRPRKNGTHSEEEDDESDDQSVHESDDESSFSDDGSSSRKRGQGSLKPPQKQRKRQRPPSPVLVDGVETWSVDRILAEDLDENGEVVYLIKWEGYFGADSWEPFSSIEQCDEALEKWENEKNYQIKHARSNQLGPDGKLLHPIVDHTEKKKKPSHRCSYAAHQAWILKQCEKALAEDRRKELNQAKAKQKSAREGKRKLKQLKREQQASVSQPQTEAQSQSSSSSSSSSISTLPSSVKESPQERRNREEKERIEQERVGQRIEEENKGRELTQFRPF